MDLSITLPCFEQLEIIFRLLCAAALGAIIGIERELHGRPAGFRTNLLVALGACVFVICSIEFGRRHGSPAIPGLPAGDPARIAAQVVAGIGFLCAGTIMRERSSVRGLTTAACVWVVAAIGMACGAGFYLLACAAAVISMISLVILKKTDWMLNTDRFADLSFIADRRETVQAVDATLSELKISTTSFSVQFSGDGSLQLVYNIKYKASCPEWEIVKQVAGIDCVSGVNFTNSPLR